MRLPARLSDDGDSHLILEGTAEQRHQMAIDAAEASISCRLCSGRGRRCDEVCPDCHGIGQMPATRKQYEADILGDASDLVHEALEKIRGIERYERFARELNGLAYRMLEVSRKELA